MDHFERRLVGINGGLLQLNGFQSLINLQQQFTAAYHPVRHGFSAQFNAVLSEHLFLPVKWQGILVFAGNDLAE